MTRNLIRVFSFFCVIVTLGSAQTPKASLLGRITTIEGKPVSLANVLIKEISLGDMSSDSGDFLISNVPPGSYIVVVSCLGFASQSHQVEIRAGETVDLRITLVEKPVDIPEIVVTGTRSEKLLVDVPIPTSVVSDKEIRARAAVRLSDLLAEQEGMFINSNQWGTGIQVEGLDPAYTLILIDGEPVVGRTAGTLELTRLSVGNIQRVEIVKGPSSSLYGSDALAAVINLITRQPAESLGVGFKSRYGSFNTLDLNGRVEAMRGGFGTSIFVERNSSNGFDLTPETKSRTTPRYVNYSLSPKLVYDFNETTKATLSARYVTQKVSNIATVLVGPSDIDFNERSQLTDWSVALSGVHRFSPTMKFEGKLYRADYRTNSELRYQTDGALFDRSTFNQTFNKAEGQLDIIVSKTMLTAAGGGYVYETVLANRISGDQRSAASYFAFAQHEWIPDENLDLIGSFRYDSHRDYAARLSPKISARVKPLSWFTVRASLGSGFKAPTFQQLYLDFTNPQVGYSVFGSVGVTEALKRLQETGQVQSVLVDPTSLQTIRPENSLSYNASIEVDPTDFLHVKINGFHNDLKDLIEAAPIATKTNGQAIYTYFNINNVFTQGFDAEITLKPISEISFSVTYQYLEAKDQNVLNEVRAGSIFKIGSTGRARPVQESEYGGLFNRSNHSGTVRVGYNNDEIGLTVNLRGILRSRYGFADNNGNNILDDDSEYAPGYALWNMTASKRVFDFLTVQVGVENMFGATNPQYTPFLPGSIAYATLSVEF